MTAIIIAIISLVVMLLLFIMMLMLTKRQDTTLTTIDENGKIKDEKGSIDKEQSIKEANEKNKSNNSKKSNGEDIKKEDIFRFMEFDRILDDMIVQRNGSRFTKAIKCKGINYDLMSEVEQLAVEEGFITFLNTLKYPIQLYVQAQNINLKNTIQKYKENTSEIEEKYNQVNEEYNKLVSSFDTDEKKLQKITKERDSVNNVYEYARDIIRYVEKMSTNKNLLQRSFYVLVSYNTSEIAAVDKFNKEEIIEMCSTELTTRCQAIISALSSCSVSGKALNSNELADLLYTAYNRDDIGLMNVQENIEAGMFRLYSTSEDAFLKQQEALEDYINTEARIRALEAIKYSITHDEINTSATDQLRQEEEISRTATNMVNAENYEQDFKDKVNKKILTDFRETKKALLELDATEKEIIKEQSKSDMEELEKLKNIEKPNGVKLIEKSKEYNNAQNNAQNVKNNTDIEINGKENTKVSESNEEKVENNERIENTINNIYKDEENDGYDDSIV